MTRDAHIFTAAELDRMLDWHRALSLRHDVVPHDDEPADETALENANLRTHSAGRPSR